MSAFRLIVGFVFAGNVVFVHLLGLCPIVSRSRNLKSAFVLGCAVAAAATAVSAGAWALTRCILTPLGLTALRGYAVLLLAAGLGSLADMAARSLVPRLHETAGTAFPIVTANCASYGAALLISGAGGSAWDSLVSGLASGAGFLLAAVLLSSLRERAAVERLPRALRGAPAVLLSAGLVAMAFMAFDGSFPSRIAP